ncbi:MAG TPA: beta-N-acetylhexosaminidase, partial [Ohtaekwangia sp.]|nr:beta-N-acetylhexosaminidase [Ohtaekwangia sp.]
MRAVIHSTCNVLSILVCLCSLVSCNNSKPASQEAIAAFDNLIPKPVSASRTGDAFFLTEGATIIVDNSDDVAAVGQYLAGKLRPATGFDLAVEQEGAKSGDIQLTLTGADPALGAEGYELSVSTDKIIISASKAAGLFYGVQTLLQILPEKIASTTKQDGPWEVAAGTIRDLPEYAWRGAMLDVARHFFGVDDVKRYIDLISYYKMNTLHLHLSDDQGWRIEIKSWPNLTIHGGATQVGGGKGGYYTQDQYKDIVRYAQERFITIVPEIDMPGHIHAALASYTELDGGTRINIEGHQSPAPAQDLGKRPEKGKVYTGIEVGFSTLRIEKEITFKFIEDVWREIASLTPGPYLHVGGDEAAATKKADYIEFVNRFTGIISALDKKMIGWEEIAQANIDGNVIVQHWSSEKYAQMAAEKGAKLIFSPAKKVYLDMQYDSTTRLGLHWAAYIEVDSAYSWDPATRIPGIEKEQIL